MTCSVLLHHTSTNRPAAQPSGRSRTRPPDSWAYPLSPIWGIYPFSRRGWGLTARVGRVIISPGAAEAQAELPDGIGEPWRRTKGLLREARANASSPRSGTWVRIGGSRISNPIASLTAADATTRDAALRATDAGRTPGASFGTPGPHRPPADGGRDLFLQRYAHARTEGVR